jgi:putative oxidoreductase
MNITHKIEQWGDKDYPAWLSLVRIGVGMLLFVKGVSFIADTKQLTMLISSLDLRLWTVTAVHYVAFVHICGGLMLAMGCLTRLAAFAQIPILVTAVLFVNISAGFSYLNSELWLSILVLYFVIIFAAIGGGKNSMDGWMKTHNA